MSVSIYVCVYICLWVYMSECIYVCVYICLCVYISVSIYVCVYVCEYMSVSIYVCVYIGLCVYVSVSLYVCVYICVCMYICLCVYTSVWLWEQDSVTWYQHSGWYTRNVKDTHPNIYVGKIGHGSNDNSFNGLFWSASYCKGECSYWDDFRNDNVQTRWTPNNIQGVPHHIRPRQWI